MEVMTVTKLFQTLLKQSVSCELVPGFNFYASMTTYHAERMIIESMNFGVIYNYKGKLLIRVGPGVGNIVLNEDDTVSIKLPYSPKHICGGRYKNKDLRRLTNIADLNYIINCIAAA